MKPFRGQIWRLVLPGQDPIAPTSQPEGRFHHSGQTALYCSLTPEGCTVAIRRYQSADEQPRLLVPLQVDLLRCADITGDAGASVVWQEGPRPSPTWAWSDQARAAGAQGMLYSSRSRPDLTHLVLFDDPRRIVTAQGQPLHEAPPAGPAT